MPVFSAVSLEFDQQRVNIFGFRDRLAGNGGRELVAARHAAALTMLATNAREF
jgi:ribosomal protein L34